MAGTSITDRDQCGNFNVIDEITDILFSDDYPDLTTTDHNPTMNNDVLYHLEIPTILDNDYSHIMQSYVTQLHEKFKLHRQSQTLQIVNENNNNNNNNNNNQKKEEQNQSNVVLSKTFISSKILRIDFNEIPHYLSKINPLFERKISSLLLPTTMKNLEQLRSIAISMYQIICIDSFSQLWHIYQQLCMAEFQTKLPLMINQIDRKFIPNEILVFIKHYQIQSSRTATTTTTTDDDDNNKNKIALNLIKNCLHQLDEQSEEYRRELRRKTCSLSYYTPQMEEFLQTFVQQGLLCLRLEIDCQIALMEYYYMDEILQRQYLIQNPTNSQKRLMECLCKLKYYQEITKNKVNFFEEIIPIHLSSHPPFDSHALVQAPLIHSIHHPSLQQEFYTDYKLIIEKVQTNSLDSYIKVYEKRMSNFDQCYPSIRTKLDEINPTVQSNERFTSCMLNIIDQRLNNITAYVECIYQFKRKLFHIKLNTDF